MSENVYKQRYPTASTPISVKETQRDINNYMMI